MDAGQIFMMAVVAWTIFAFLGAYVSQAKGRPGFEGVVFGVMLGPIGLLIAALMPSLKTDARADAATVAPPTTTDRPERSRPARRIGGPGDDKAMDFVMDLIKLDESDDPDRSVPRITRPRA